MGRGLGLGLLLRLPGQELLRVPPEEGVDHDVPGLRAREHAAQVLDLGLLDGTGARGLGSAKLANFAKLILQMFGGLVLGCIKTKFCKKICV